jgi:hypothetical protein
MQLSHFSCRETSVEVLHRAGVAEGLLDSSCAGGVVGEVWGEEADAIGVLGGKVEELVWDGAADEENAVQGWEGEEVAGDGEADAWGWLEGERMGDRGGCVGCGMEKWVMGGLWVWL